MTARTIAENGGENNLKKQYLKERQMKDYPEEYDQENLDNQYLAEAFPDAKGLGDLYRQTYKYTACGPWLSAEFNTSKCLRLMVMAAICHMKKKWSNGCILMTCIALALGPIWIPKVCW
jgi:hypothetical protein